MHTWPGTTSVVRVGNRKMFASGTFCNKECERILQGERALINVVCVISFDLVVQLIMSLNRSFKMIAKLLFSELISYEVAANSKKRFQETKFWTQDQGGQ